MTNDDNLNTLAPSIAADWRDDFVIELRLQGASGASIAEALVEVEGHCRESGQSASEAFGPAVDYAKALDLPDESAWTRAQLVRTWVGILLLVGGVSLTLWGGLAFFLAQGQRAEVTLGWLMSGGATIALMVLVFVLGERLMRFVLAHAVWSAVGFGTAIAAGVAVGIPFRNVLLARVPAVLPLGVGIVALLAWVTVIIVWRRAGKGLDDPLISPTPSTSRDRM